MAPAVKKATTTDPKNWTKPPMEKRSSKPMAKRLEKKAAMPDQSAVDFVWLTCTASWL
jgi:hypothetical protein